MQPFNFGTQIKFKLHKCELIQSYSVVDILCITFNLDRHMWPQDSGNKENHYVFLKLRTEIMIFSHNS